MLFTKKLKKSLLYLPNFTLNISQMPQYFQTKANYDSRPPGVSAIDPLGGGRGVDDRLAGESEPMSVEQTISSWIMLRILATFTAIMVLVVGAAGQIQFHFLLSLRRILFTFTLRVVFLSEYILYKIKLQFRDFISTEKIFMQKCLEKYLLLLFLLITLYNRK